MEAPYTAEDIDKLSEEIVKVLHSIYDPEIPIDIYELGLIYDVAISEEGVVDILMTLTAPNCPVADSLPQEVEDKVALISGIKSAEVELTFEPMWTQDMISEEGRFELGLL